MIKDIKKPVVKSLNSFKEIGKDFKSGLDKRADKALDSPYDFANYLTLGAVDGIWSGAKGRADKMLDSPSDFFNYATFGFTGMVQGAVNPKDPLSKEHWLDSFGVATSVLGVKGASSTKTTGVSSGKSTSSSSNNSNSNSNSNSNKGTGNTKNIDNPKLPLQVKYGESDLSSMAKNYRIDNQIYDLRNIVVADIEIDGARFSKVFESTEKTRVKPSGKVEVKKVHSEKVLVEEKKAAELNGQTYKVHRVYTEREPCILGGHDCKALLKKELPEAEVSYSVEYGDKASRDRGNAELAKELEKLKE